MAQILSIRNYLFRKNRNATTSHKQHVQKQLKQISASWHDFVKDMWEDREEECVWSRSQSQAIPTSEAWAIAAWNHTDSLHASFKAKPTPFSQQGASWELHRPPDSLARRAVLAPYDSHHFHEGCLEQALWPHVLSMQHRHFQKVRETDEHFIKSGWQLN